MAEEIPLGPVPQYTQLTPDMTFPRLQFGRVNRFQYDFSFEPAADRGDASIYSRPPFSPKSTVVGEPVDDVAQMNVILKEGYVIERPATGDDAILLHIPTYELALLDAEPAPIIPVPVGKAVFVRIQTDTDGAISEGVTVVVEEADMASTRHVPVSESEAGTSGDYYIKIGETVVTEDIPSYKTYVQSDIVYHPESGTGSSTPAAETLHPWKLRLVDGSWQVYGTGSTIEKRWTGDLHTVTGLDTNLTIGESSYYIYARATVEYGVVSDFEVTVETTALDRVVTAAGQQTELNILIGMIVSGTATQRLRDPVNLTLTCVAGVPAWVPLLSEGVAP
jgi:hypothetical protein